MFTITKKKLCIQLSILLLVILSSCSINKTLPQNEESSHSFQNQVDQSQPNSYSLSITRNSITVSDYAAESFTIQVDSNSPNATFYLYAPEFLEHFEDTEFSGFYDAESRLIEFTILQIPNKGENIVLDEIRGSIDLGNSIITEKNDINNNNSEFLALDNKALVDIFLTLEKIIIKEIQIKEE